MSREIITQNAEETKNLGRKLAKEFQGGEIVCLEGNLGAGKTTFTQGLLSELAVPKPHISPTFLIMKEYILSGNKIKKIYHIDAYRVKSEDILGLGWEEIVQDKNNVIIVEWADRISDIIPASAIRIDFEWVDEEKRKIVFR